MENKIMKKIGIIGAGAAGLCAARQSLATREFTPIVWEHSAKVGGTWAFNPNVGKDQHGYPIHSSMYCSLRTNLPKEVMAFPDFPFKQGGKSFIHHSEVCQYLNEYADNFDLWPWIKFEHHVSNVERVENEAGDQVWKVTAKDLISGISETTLCDAILICNGHYSVPKIPEIPGIDGYSGTLSHSHDYRNSEGFEGKDVIVLGAAASGMDISLEIAKVANHTYLSHNFPVPIPSKLPSNVTQVKGIQEATHNGFILRDGTRVQADALIFCTGYEFDFPFLSNSCGIRVESNQVRMLHKHIINTAHPSMGFVGVAFQILPFPVFDMQILYFLSLHLGRLESLSEQEMNSAIDREFKRKSFQGTKATHFHYLGPTQWSYMKELGDLIERNNPKLIALESLYNLTWERRKLSLPAYKDNDYNLVFNSETDFRIEEFRSGNRINTSLELMALRSIQLPKLFLFHFTDTIKFIFNSIRIRLKTFFYSPPP